MSDRTRLFELDTGSNASVEMYMDGESGTWRLFIPDLYSVDFSLEGLRAFHEALGKVLQDIERDPEEFNAELRRDVLTKDAS